MNEKLTSLPKYTHQEEVANSLTHLAGSLFAIGLIIYLIIFNVSRSLSFFYVLPFYIYAIGMLVMFVTSTLYHSAPLNSRYRAVTRIIDHCDIFFFVAATYTPICVHNLAAYPNNLIMLLIEWVFALVGIILNIISLTNKPIKIISFVMYIITGWLLIFFYPFGCGISLITFLFVLIGGVVYSAGSIAYAVGSKKKWYHTIFHITVLLAAVLQFIGIYFLL